MTLASRELGLDIVDLALVAAFAKSLHIYAHPRPKESSSKLLERLLKPQVEVYGVRRPAIPRGSGRVAPRREAPGEVRESRSLRVKFWA